MSFNNGSKATTGRRARSKGAKTILELKHGEGGVLDKLDLPEDISRRLMELGFLPGQVVTPGFSAPGGDPRVFRVDGSEIALRRETAAHLYVQHETELV